MFKQAFFTEAGDLFFGGFGWDVELGGDGEIGGAVEIVWEHVVKELTVGGLAVVLSGRQSTEDVGGVLQKHTSHDERGLEIGVVANDNRRNCLTVHKAKCG